MNRQELNALMESGAIRIFFNNSTSVDIVSRENLTISDFSIVVVFTDDNGKLRHRAYPLTSIISVELLEPVEENETPSEGE